MAVRASQQLAARLGAGQGPAAEIAALPSVAAVTGAHEVPGPYGPAAGGDDDSPGELDTGGDYYADALEVLP
jgi:hypothetical protein